MPRCLGSVPVLLLRLLLRQDTAGFHLNDLPDREFLSPTNFYNTVLERLKYILECNRRNQERSHVCQG